VLLSIRTTSITTTPLAPSVSGSFYSWAQEHDSTLTSVIRSRFFLFLGSWTVATTMLAYIPGFLFFGKHIFFGALSHLIYIFATFAMWMSGTAALTQALGGGLNCDGCHRHYAHCNQLNTLEAFGWITSAPPAQDLLLYLS
jgi:hypothetical protein